MLKKSLFAPLFLVLILLSCVGEENPDSGIPSDGELKINILGDYFTNYNEYWVILHTTDGEVLEAKKLEGENSVIFQIDDSKRYHLTSYTKSEFHGSRVELIKSYTDIAVNEDLSLGLESPRYPSPATSGEFTVNISNTNYPFAALVSGYNSLYNGRASQTGSKIELISSHQTDINEYFLIARDESGEIRYDILDIPNPGVTISRNFSDLKQFDKVFKFNKSDFSAFTYTNLSLSEVNNEMEDGYIINTNQLMLLQIEPRVDYQIGFLSQFENYFLNISGKRASSKTSFSYRRIGTMPSSIILPEDREIEVQNKLVSDFRFTMPSGDTNWTALWDQSEPFDGQVFKTLRWTVRGSKPNVKLSLPAALTQDKPQLQDLSKFNFKSVELFKHSQSYDKQIRDQLVEWPKTEPLEFSSVIQYF